MSVASIQPHVDNRMDSSLDSVPSYAGIIGERPSVYAKSPSIWNPAFRALGLPFVYTAFDVVQAAALGGLVAALRDDPRYLGGNVTMPYKVAVMPHLDDIDAAARSIGAVNTIARDDAGRLIGYNTDGQGAIDSLTKVQPSGGAPLFASLEGCRTLLLGAGGAARAVAFAVASATGGAPLYIANRDASKARELADGVRSSFGTAHAIDETEIADVIGEVDLVANCSTKGQTGLRDGGNGRAITLEPYSALAAANPSPAPRADREEAVILHETVAASKSDIDRNAAESLALCLAMRPATVCFDAVYAPLESAFLRHARLTGHRTVNGKGMNVGQAADGMFNRVCRPALRAASRWTPDTYAEILRVMYDVW
ncbi:MAG TPA: hypothetical protein VGM67_02560 [Gemmatimonadaceae bacterium]|jgi:shikimate dehydrogenase